MSQWTWAAATTRGTSHIKTATRRQDAFRCYVPDDAPDFLICVVSDGAGSAEYGGEGAALVCRTFSLAAQESLRAHRELPTDELVRSWLDLIRDQISFAASNRGKVPRDFAATMIAVLSDGEQTLIAQVGDGCAALKNGDKQEWQVLLWPDHGEYASTTTFVTDDPEPKCRIVRSSSAIVGFAAMTDGLERLALDFASQTPSTAFFDGMLRPAIASSVLGKDQLLSRALKEYLEGDSVCARTDDDKTLVVVARK